MIEKAIKQQEQKHSQNEGGVGNIFAHNNQEKNKNKRILQMKDFYADDDKYQSDVVQFSIYHPELSEKL